MCVESAQLLGENRVRPAAQGSVDVSLLDSYRCSQRESARAREREREREKETESADVSLLESYRHICMCLYVCIYTPSDAYIHYPSPSNPLTPLTPSLYWQCAESDEPRPTSRVTQDHHKTGGVFVGVCAGWARAAGGLGSHICIQTTDLCMMYVCIHK